MPDYGTLISDARGLHDVSKNSFDSLSKDIRQPINASNLLLRESFSATFNKFKKKIAQQTGLDVDGGITLENIASQVTKELQTTVGRISLESATGYAVSALAEMEGPLGLVLSEALTIASSEFANYFLSKQHFKPGQWVFIDLGQRNVHRVNEKPKIIELQEEFNVFGTVPLIPGELDYASEAHHSIGFVLGQDSSGDYLWNVLSLENGKESKVHEEKLRACPADFAEKLDKNPAFSSVREVVFLKDHDPTLDSYVPTEPGEKVWLNNKPAKIIEQAGDEWVVELPDGSHVLVHKSEIKAGKTDSNTTWNHDTVHLGSRTSLSPDAIFKGEWVWVSGKNLISTIIDNKRRRMKDVPDILTKMGPENLVLAMVQSIHGKSVHLVHAYDGSEFDMVQEKIKPASADVQHSLDKQFVTWKQEVLGGETESAQTPGESHPFLTLGLGELSGKQVREFEMAPFSTNTKTETVGLLQPVKSFSGASGKVDTALETQFADEQEDANTFFGLARDGTETKIIYEEIEKTNTDGNNNLMYLALGIAVIVVISSV